MKNDQSFGKSTLVLLALLSNGAVVPVYCVSTLIVNVVIGPGFFLSCLPELTTASTVWPFSVPAAWATPLMPTDRASVAAVPIRNLRLRIPLLFSRATSSGMTLRRPFLSTLHRT